MKVFGSSLVHIFLLLACYGLALLRDHKEGYLFLWLISEASVKAASFLLCVVHCAELQAIIPSYKGHDLVLKEFIVTK